MFGLNGVGKFILLKMIIGMFRLNCGEILFNGYKWSRKDLCEIGFLIELVFLYENLIVKENLKVWIIVFGLLDLRIEEVFNIVEFEDIGKKRMG